MGGMFGWRYHRGSPNDHIIQYRNGRVRREGRGLSFFYFSPTSVIQRVPCGSGDLPFVFEEASADFQEVTIQGDITYQIENPERIAQLLDFSTDQRGCFRSDDPSKIGDRLIHATQLLTRAFVGQHSLQSVLAASTSLAELLQKGLDRSGVVQMLGLKVLAVSVAAIRGTPEITKALQAESRENLLQLADEAMYARRNVAVELERQIKENELQTEIAVAKKQLEIREKKVQADIAIEQQRSELVEQRTANDMKEAKARGAALRESLEPIKDVDWRTLLAVGSGGGLGTGDLIAMAFRDLADNAEKVGSINITSELLSSLVAPQPSNTSSLRTKRHKSSSGDS